MNKQLRRPIKYTAAHINGLLPIFTSEMTVFTQTSHLYSLSPIHAHLAQQGHARCYENSLIYCFLDFTFNFSKSAVSWGPKTALTGECLY